MNRISGLAVGLGVTVMMVIGLACGNGETTSIVESDPTPVPQATEEPGEISGGVFMGSMAPRPSSVDELVSRASIIVVGTIESVLAEKIFGPYGEDGQPLPVDDESGLPFTDYDLQIESVLKSDGTVTDGGSLVLRLFGHLSNENVIITLNLFTLPKPGDRLLFALGQNPDGTYGSGPEGLLSLDGDRVEYFDGVPFAIVLSPGELVEEIEGS